MSEFAKITTPQTGSGVTESDKVLVQRSGLALWSTVSSLGVTSLDVSGDVTVNTDALVVDSTNKRIGVGKAAPTVAVDVVGDIAVTGTVDGRDVAADGTKLDGIESGADVTDTTNVTAAGALMESELANVAAVKAINQGLATNNSPTFSGLNIPAGSTEVRFIEIGAGRSADGISFIDMIGDATYSGYGLRFIRNGGLNSTSEIAHRGAGPLSLRVQDAGYVQIKTSDTERMRIDSSGNVGIGTASPTTELHVNGAIRHNVYTVATLPAAATVGAGSRAMVSDANATTFASTVAGGGANVVPVYSDGTNWKIG